MVRAAATRHNTTSPLKRRLRQNARHACPGATQREGSERKRKNRHLINVVIGLKEGSLITYPGVYEVSYLPPVLFAQNPSVFLLVSGSISAASVFRSSGLSKNETNMPPFPRYERVFLVGGGQVHQSHSPSICQATWQCRAQTPGLSARKRSTTWDCAGTVTVSRRMGLSRFHVVVLAPAPNWPGPHPTI